MIFLLLTGSVCWNRSLVQWKRKIEIHLVERYNVGIWITTRLTSCSTAAYPFPSHSISSLYRIAYQESFSIHFLLKAIPKFHTYSMSNEMLSRFLYLCEFPRTSPPSSIDRPTTTNWIKFWFWAWALIRLPRMVSQALKRSVKGKALFSKFIYLPIYIYSQR